MQWLHSLLLQYSCKLNIGFVYKYIFGYVCRQKMLIIKIM